VVWGGTLSLDDGRGVAFLSPISNQAVKPASDGANYYTERAGDEDSEQRALVGLRGENYRAEEPACEANASKAGGADGCPNCDFAEVHFRTIKAFGAPIFPPQN
jgi:hypothetical protein